MAACGTALTHRHGQILGQLASGHTIIAFDDDRAGHLAAERAYAALAGQVGSLHTAALSEGRDPADILGRLGPHALRRQIIHLQPLADVIVDRRISSWPNLNDNAEARVACLREVAIIVARMTPIDLTCQARRLIKALHLDPSTVTRELANRVTNVGCPSRLSSRSEGGMSYPGSTAS